MQEPLSLSQLDAPPSETPTAHSTNDAILSGTHGDIKSPKLAATFGSTLLTYFRNNVVLPLRSRTKGISKDQAEEIAMRRFHDGRAIKAGFIEENGKRIWEFEVVDGTDVHRVGVDVLTANIVQNQNLRSGEFERSKSYRA